MTTLRLDLPDELVEEIAARVAELVLERLERGSAKASPYLTVAEAAELYRCDRQRLYDLCSARRLTKHKDGRRVLLVRQELEQLFAPVPRREPEVRPASR